MCLFLNIVSFYISAWQIRHVVSLHIHAIALLNMSVLALHMYVSMMSLHMYASQDSVKSHILLQCHGQTRSRFDIASRIEAHRKWSRFLSLATDRWKRKAARASI